MTPHRGVLVLVLGILGLVGCGIFTSIPAWVIGSGDLKAMDAGTMDPSGRSLTNAGKICGMIATIIAIVAVVLVGLLIALGVAIPVFQKH